MIIGGSEDRTENKTILERFVKQCGGTKSKILILTAASTVPDQVWRQYDDAFKALGTPNHSHLHIQDRSEAGDAAIQKQVATADGIFITGGDQKRLLASTGGTPLHDALHDALKRGACIAGTSAGASAMSAHMLASGKAELQAAKGAIALGAGYGLLTRFVIDQHFSERHRLARLLSVVADNPNLFGMGIDEDTAFLIEQNRAIEVLGSGAVTILDGRHVVSNVADIEEGECLEMADVRLHLLPSGSRYGTGDGAGKDKSPSAPLADILNLVTQIA
jgi:cyanophycinase